jgi:hypothetical protein
MSTCSKRQLHLWLHDTVNGLFNVGLEYVSFSQFLVPMSRKPDPAQGAFLGQNDVGVKHDLSPISSGCKKNFELVKIFERK